MRIKDIVNKQNTNLRNCDTEPIHIPGCIQEHGFLLAVTRELFTIDFCSANLAAFTGLSPEKVLGKPLRAIFSVQQEKDLQSLLEDPAFDQNQQFVFTYAGISYHTRPHLSGNLVILEFEPFPDGSLAVPDLYNQTRKLVELLKKVQSLRELSQAITQETRRLTGYDRVMIYRFDKDYNGEVYAESKRDDLLPLLGHHYPHTDIPAQARALYLQNMLRMIADVHYTPVPLLTLASNNADNSSLDLSISVLRSVSPLHIEYLKNMGVGATLTISLVLDGRLWGMIACHHYTPRNIPHFTRLAALLQGYFFTSQIKVRQAADEYAEAQQLDKCIQPLRNLIAKEEYFIGNEQCRKELCSCLKADGVAIIQGSQVFTTGLVPTEEAILQLVTWLKENASGHLITDRLVKLYPATQTWAETAAGIIYYALDTEAFHAIIWFRTEMQKAIHWAGNPTKAVIMEAGGARLSPRKSFELWKEVVKNQSTEWTGPECSAAAQLAYDLQKQVYLLRIRQEQENYRKLTTRLKTLNAELEDFNWISAHDLKEPLRKIQVFASRAAHMNNSSIAVYEDSLRRIQNAAYRMQQLLDSMLSFADMSKSAAHFQLTDLHQTLKGVLAGFGEKITTGNITIKITGRLPELFVIPGQMERLFTHLVDNAIRFARPGVPLHLHIQSETLPDANQGRAGETAQCHTIVFTDNGIGFNNKFAETIFRIFQVLDRSGDGVGIGLPLCKKIMDNHDGSIEAKGHEGEGAVFTLRLPC